MGNCNHKILGVMSSKEKAKYIVNQWNKNTNNKVQMEEYVMDGLEVKVMCCLVIDRTGKIIRTWEYSVEEKDVETPKFWPTGEMLFCELNTEKEDLIQKAKKIRAIALANNIWGNAKELNSILSRGQENEE